MEAELHLLLSDFVSLTHLA